MIGITPISSIYHMRLKVQIVAAVLTVVTLICGCILMQYLTRKVSRQINALSDTIQNAAKGEIGIQAPVYMNDDIGKIARRFNEMSLQNKKLIEELVQAEAQKTAQKWRQWITSTVSSIHRLIPILSITVWRLSMPLQR